MVPQLSNCARSRYRCKHKHTYIGSLNNTWQAMVTSTLDPLHEPWTSVYQIRVIGGKAPTGDDPHTAASLAVAVQ
ncbi:predicted protein [Lichtheimia corymbifera JMRC:FSU:9682]|uniref:Uncharacterized protein n=1 Tax=Lichtheimia corymbifera JMRC:FSU:9682 TaxID=1263082 RepID=A0A068S6L7_9FUNG|nr:predicted protein [Lichtheimia corymbifera JMRC:FSU:9682]